MNHYPLDRDLIYQIRSGTSTPEATNKNAQLFKRVEEAQYFCPYVPAYGRTLPLQAATQALTSTLHDSLDPIGLAHFIGCFPSGQLSCIVADPVKHRDAPLPSFSSISPLESHLWGCIRREADKKKMILSRREGREEVLKMLTKD